MSSSSTYLRQRVQSREGESHRNEYLLPWPQVAIRALIERRQWHNQNHDISMINKIPSSTLKLQ